MFTKKELYCANCGKKIDLKFGLPDSCTNCKIRFEFPKITQKHGITGFLLLFTLSLAPIWALIELIRPMMNASRAINIGVTILALFGGIVWFKTVLTLLNQYGFYVCRNIDRRQQASSYCKHYISEIPKHPRITGAKCKLADILKFSPLLCVMQYPFLTLKAINR